MRTYDGFNVRHTTVAHFQRILVEDFVELRFFREMFSNQVEKAFSDVGGNILVEGWIVPDDFPLPCLLILVVVWWSWVVFKGVVVSRFSECIFIEGCGCFEYLLVGRKV